VAVLSSTPWPRMPCTGAAIIGFNRQLHAEPGAFGVSRPEAAASPALDPASLLQGQGLAGKRVLQLAVDDIDLGVALIEVEGFPVSGGPVAAKKVSCASPLGCIDWLIRGASPSPDPQRLSVSPSATKRSCHAHGDVGDGPSGKSQAHGVNAHKHFGGSPFNGWAGLARTSVLAGSGIVAAEWVMLGSRRAVGAIPLIPLLPRLCATENLTADSLLTSTASMPDGSGVPA
jgi:hypothetical protein